MKKIWLCGVGEFDSIENSYLGRWTSICASPNDDIKIITTTYVHSKDIIFEPNKETPTNIVGLDCGGYNGKRSFSRMRYHILFTLKFILYFLKNSDNVDIIVFNAVPHENVLGILLAKLKGKKVILDVRDSWASIRGGIFVNLFSKYCNLLFKIQCRCSKFILITSWKYKHYIKKDTVFHPLGFEEIEGTKRFNDISEIGKYKVGYIGNESPQYDLIKAVRDIKKSNLISEIEIVGSYSIAYKNEILALQDENLEISFLGYLKGELNKKDVLTNWHFGLIPDLSKSQVGLPNKAFDYIKYRIPILYVGNKINIKALDIEIFCSEGWGTHILNLKNIKYLKILDFITINYNKYSRKSLNKTYIQLLKK